MLANMVEIPEKVFTASIIVCTHSLKACIRTCSVLHLQRSYVRLCVCCVPTLVAMLSCTPLLHSRGDEDKEKV